MQAFRTKALQPAASCRGLNKATARILGGHSAGAAPFRYQRRISSRPSAAPTTMASSYSLTITTDSAVRKKMQNNNMKLIFAKGVTTGGPPAYNTAWFVLGADEMAKEINVTWDVEYKANYMLDAAGDGFKLKLSGNDVELSPGHYYNVDRTSELIEDPNKPPEGDSAFHFANDFGYKREYIPVLKTLAPGDSGEFVPFWTATSGVLHNGTISATPVEKVRVWVGKYEAGAAVLADYASQAIEFDLTDITSGNAELLSDLSGWTKKHSENAKIGRRLVANTVSNLAVGPAAARVLITTAFTTAVSVGCATYLSSILLSKFQGNLRPKTIKVSTKEITFEFDTSPQKLLAAANNGSKDFVADPYEEAVELALIPARTSAKQQFKEEIEWTSPGAVSIQALAGAYA